MKTLWLNVIDKKYKKKLDLYTKKTLYYGDRIKCLKQTQKIGMNFAKIENERKGVKKENKEKKVIKKGEKIKKNG